MTGNLSRPWMTARRLLQVCFGVRLPVNRLVYGVTGFGLMAVKYIVEAGLIYYFTCDWLTPFEFVNPLLSERTRLAQAGPEWLGWVLFMWTLPFVWIAFSMSVRRVANAGLSPWLGLLIFIPLLNLALMFIFAILPDRERMAGVVGDDRPENYFAAPQTRGEYWSPEAWRRTLEDQTYSRTRRKMLAVSCSLAIGAVMLAIDVYGFDTYGISLFFATPLVMGTCCGFVYNRPESQSFAGTTGVVVLSLFIAGGVLLVVALEGLICVLMAFPLIVPLGIFGGFIGKAIADSTRAGYLGMLPVIISMPLLSATENFHEPPGETLVLTTVEVAAPPEVVWHYVVQFPDLPYPDEWYFGMGIAAPLRARIDGIGVGAKRYCEFTTGTFVEPVTAWEEPCRLAFDVADQPDPMFELSPYRYIHPPHMEHATLRSNRGEFQLIRLPNGKSRLEGRTWYQFAMYPQDYWTLWSHAIIHRIHRRVLLHIKELAEEAAENYANSSLRGDSR
jgi:uncharacterized membrane protein YhaH (DUF805 family)